MKNPLSQMVHTTEIDSQKCDSKKFYRFIAVFERRVSQNEIIISSNIKIHLINQPPSECIQLLTPKDQLLVFGQIVEEGRLIQGQVRKVSVEDALKYDNMMKKLKFKAFEKSAIMDTQNRFMQIEADRKNTSSLFGYKNGGFSQHF